MKIAVDFSNDFFVSHREGICVYNAFLIQSLLENYPDISIDIFTNEINIPELKIGMETYYNKFKNRISFITPLQQMKKWYKINYIKYFLYCLKQQIYALRAAISKKEKYIMRKNKIKDKKNFLIMGSIKSLFDFAACSEADIVFCDIVNLKTMHYFKCPKVFMLHDLFTITLADLFRESTPNIDEINQNAINNLMQYAAEKAYFVTSGKYIRNENLLKYITNISADKTFIIPFPPMIRKIKAEHLLSEAEFRQKFNIKGTYIPYASQNRHNKNVILLLKALKRLKDKGINISIVTTGDFFILKKCADFIKQNNLKSNIIQIGSISESDLYALYKYASMAVIPTIIEGLGMSGQCLEALSFKTIPVIHAKSLGMKESLESVGLSFETADLNWVDLDDDKTLADKIEDVLSNPQPHIEKQKHIIDAYTLRTWSDVAHDYISIFNKAIKDNYHA